MDAAGLMVILNLVTRRPIHSSHDSTDEVRPSRMLQHCCHRKLADVPLAPLHCFPSAGADCHPWNLNFESSLTPFDLGVWLAPEPRKF
jgi:hypothetical protein